MDSVKIDMITKLHPDPSVGYIVGQSSSESRLSWYILLADFQLQQLCMIFGGQGGSHWCSIVLRTFIINWSEATTRYYV